jgi:hypothetical protein
VLSLWYAVGVLVDTVVLLLLLWVFMSTPCTRAGVRLFLTCQGVQVMVRLQCFWLTVVHSPKNRGVCSPLTLVRVINSSVGAANRGVRISQAVA